MNNKKQYVFALIIIVFACGVSWWSSKNRSSVSNHIEEEVTRLVPRFVSDPTSIRGLVVDPVLEPILASSLQNVILETSRQNKSYVVVVLNGDDKSFGDGTATHVARVNVSHRPIVALRIICTSETDPLLIAGVFSEYEQEEIYP
jgi:hypothetical protein